MCLRFTYSGCYTAKRVWNKHSWHQRPAKTLDGNLFWLWPEHHRCWRDHLRVRSCVHAGGGHFERMLWSECSCIWFSRTFDETVNLIIGAWNGNFVVIIKSWSCVYICTFGFWATVCKTVRPILWDRCLSCLSVCLSVLSVTFMHCGQTVGRIKMKLCVQVGLGRGHIVLHGDPAHPLPKGHSPPIFGPYLLRPNGCMDQDRCHLVWS